MKRCSRCGCFFIGEDTVCFNCIPYDNSDKAKLTEYFSNNVNLTYEDIMFETGIAPCNLTRFLNSPDYSKFAKDIEKFGVENYE